MTLLALIRHGVTEWNEKGIVQGRSDIPLSEGGRQQVEQWKIPSEIDGFKWIASPLSRAFETASILTGRKVPTDERLVEMNWSAWEGQTLPALRAELGNLVAAWEAKGLDFKSPDGESPREVQARLQPFLQERAAAGQDTVAVCHKGVIRAVYALAIGWDMTDKPPRKLKEECVHIFKLNERGDPAIHALDIAMTGQS